MSIKEFFNRKSALDMDTKRKDSWFMDSRGQGVLNMEKALKSSTGRKLLNIEQSHSDKEKEEGFA